LSFRENACTTCKVASVCRVKTLLDKKTFLDEAMNGCHFYQPFGDQSIFLPGEKKDEVPRRNVMLDVGEISRKIHEITDKPRKEPKIIPPSDNATCASCGETNVQLVVCQRCGAQICADCMTETINGEILCPECYDRDEPMNI